MSSGCSQQYLQLTLRWSASLHPTCMLRARRTQFLHQLNIRFHKMTYLTRPKRLSVCIPANDLLAPMEPFSESQRVCSGDTCGLALVIHCFHTATLVQGWRSY